MLIFYTQFDIIEAEQVDKLAFVRKTPIRKSTKLNIVSEKNVNIKVRISRFSK